MKEHLKDTSDHQSINFPAFKPSSPTEDDIYVYSGFVAPGRHSVIVYLPSEDTFHLRIILVKHRRADLELTEKKVTPVKAGITPVRNVFCDWNEPTLEDYQYAVESDWNSRYFKVKQAIEKKGINLPKVREIITTNSLLILELYELMIFNSSHYPRCSIQDIREIFEKIGVSEPNGWAMINFESVTRELGTVSRVTETDDGEEVVPANPIAKEPMLNRA